jgi:predicted DNA-binding transcriptional regulator AlpA
MRQDSYEWDRLLTAQEVAAIARVHKDTFHRWCREGKGPPETRLGNVGRYAESDVRRWIEARREPGDSPSSERPEVA